MKHQHKSDFMTKEFVQKDFKAKEKKNKTLTLSTKWNPSLSEVFEKAMLNIYPLIFIFDVWRLSNLKAFLKKTAEFEITCVYE